MSDWVCEECGLELFSPLGYMLWDAVWLAVRESKEGHLCVFCLEARLGRLLVGADFVRCGLNEGMEDRLAWMREEGHDYWLDWARQRREQLNRRNQRARERRQERKALVG